MNAHVNNKDPIVVFIISIILMGLFLSTIPAEQSGEAVEEMTLVEIQKGQILNLANLPENMVLPNGMILKNTVLVNEGPLAGTISAVVIYAKETKPLKIIWLDSVGNEISHSSHTVLNSPPFGVEEPGDKIKIWSLYGADQVKLEIWE